MNSSDLQFRWAEGSDLPLIQDFLRAEFGPESVQATPGRCEWLYFNNPLGLHVTLCLTPEGDLVGFCGHLPQVVHLGGEDITAGFGVDFMVAPAWRRQGIGRQFLTMRMERFRLSLSVGQSAAMGHLYRRYGASDLGSFRRGFRRTRPGFSRQPRVLARHTLAWLAGRRSRPAVATNWQPTPAAQLTPWQHWRFATGPYADYMALVAQPESSAMAFIRRAGPVSHIVSVQASSQERAAVLDAVTHWRSPVETQIMFCGDRLTEDCRRAGFFLRDHDAHLIGATADEALRRELQPGCLDMFAGAGDADLLRRPPSTADHSEATT